MGKTRETQVKKRLSAYRAVHGTVVNAAGGASFLNQKLLFLSNCLKCGFARFVQLWTIQSIEFFCTYDELA